MPVSTPDLRPWLIRTVVWVLVLGTLWYVAGGVYERLLANVVAKLLPANTFLALKDNTFFIGYGPPQRPLGPMLQFVSHNFGFGLALAGAVVLGAPGRSWRSRLAGLVAVSVLLFMSHVWVLVQAATLEAWDARDVLGLRLGRFLLWGMYASSAVVPGVLAVVWLLLPLGMKKVKERRTRPGQARAARRAKRR